MVEIFGLSLTMKQTRFFYVSPESFGGKIPFIVSDLVKQLMNLHAERVEGVFRLNGSDSKVKQLIQQLDKGIIHDWSEYRNIHTVATCLKRYFRNMAETEPIVPFEVFDCVIGLMRVKDVDHELKVLPNLLRQIPPVRYLTLAFLCKYLNYLLGFREFTRMGADNIAICVAPNILVGKPDNSDQVFDYSAFSNAAFSLMVEHYNVIFSNVRFPKTAFCAFEDIALLNSPQFTPNFLQFQIRKWQERKNSLIPFVPTCRIKDEGPFKRPTRTPPKPFLNDVSSIDGEWDFFESQIASENSSVSETEQQYQSNEINSIEKPEEEKMSQEFVQLDLPKELSNIITPIDIIIEGKNEICEPIEETNGILKVNVEASYMVYEYNTDTEYEYHYISEEYEYYDEDVIEPISVIVAPPQEKDLIEPTNSVSNSNNDHSNNYDIQNSSPDIESIAQDDGDLKTGTEITFDQNTDTQETVVHGYAVEQDISNDISLILESEKIGNVDDKDCPQDIDAEIEDNDMEAISNQTEDFEIDTKPDEMFPNNEEIAFPNIPDSDEIHPIDQLDQETSMNEDIAISNNSNSVDGFKTEDITQEMINADSFNQEKDYDFKQEIISEDRTIVESLDTIHDDNIYLIDSEELEYDHEEEQILSEEEETNQHLGVIHQPEMIDSE